jgi:uncharacterized membrane protein
MNTRVSKEFLDTMSRESGNWKGPFYFNSRDPRILVPKLHPSSGWTLNFASQYSYIFLLAIIFVAIVCIVFL